MLSIRFVIPEVFYRESSGFSNHFFWIPDKKLRELQIILGEFDKLIHT